MPNSSARRGKTGNTNVKFNFSIFLFFNSFFFKFEPRVKALYRLLKGPNKPSYVVQMWIGGSDPRKRLESKNLVKHVKTCFL